MMLRTLMEYHSPREVCGSTSLYSNSYSNADDRQHYLAIHSEQQGQEISTKRTPRNNSKHAQAHPVFGTAPLIAKLLNVSEYCNTIYMYSCQNKNPKVNNILTANETAKPAVNDDTKQHKVNNITTI